MYAALIDSYTVQVYTVYLKGFQNGDDRVGGEACMIADW